jgi:transposase
MGKPYSEDLRKRVVAAVDTGGLSCNQAAKQFGIGISTAIGWVRRLRETGRQSSDGQPWSCLSRTEISIFLICPLQSGHSPIGGFLRQGWPNGRL